MHYYDHYHDPNSHLQLARQREHELLRAATRCEIRPGLFTRLRTHLRGAVPAPHASEEVTILSAASDATGRARRSVVLGDTRYIVIDALILIDGGDIADRVLEQ